MVSDLIILLWIYPQIIFLTMFCRVMECLEKNLKKTQHI
jgi:hypothetical protein